MTKATSISAKYSNLIFESFYADRQIVSYTSSVFVHSSILGMGSGFKNMIMHTGGL